MDLLAITTFLAIVQTRLACEWVDGISFDDLNFQIKGHGFHRTLETGFKLTNKQRLINCRLSYRYRIPNGAYLDSNTIGADLAKHCFVPSNFDVEAPVSSPKVAEFHPVYFHSTSVLRKLFIFEDSLEVPVHLRYHKPVGRQEDGLEATVKFEFPMVYVQCDENSTIFKDANCKNFVEKIPCGCNSHTPLCEYLRLKTPEPRTVAAKIPISSEEHRISVILFTLFIVFSCIAYTFYTVHCSSSKNKQE